MGGGPCATGDLCALEQDGPVNSYPEEYTTIENQNYYIIGGGLDPLVTEDWIDSSAAFFTEAGATVTKKFYEDIGHVWSRDVPDEERVDCDAETFHNQNCEQEYGFVREWVQSAIPDAEPVTNYLDNGQFMVVDTTPYQQEGSALADFALLYVPNACLEK